MEPIKTASTHERIIRNGILTAMVVLFSAWSLYDGYVRYPQNNLGIAKQELPPESQDSATISKAVRERTVKDVVKKGGSLAEVEEAFGPPSWRGKGEGESLNSVWFGPGGTLIVRHLSTGVIVAGPEWKPGQKRELDLSIQKIMGYVLGVVEIFLVIRLVSMATRGAELSDAGLKPAGQPLIPFDGMTGWDTSKYRERGRIRLAFNRDGRESSYVLDDYKLRAFPEIVGEICARKGYENPVKKKEAARGDDAAATA